MNNTETEILARAIENLQKTAGRVRVKYAQNRLADKGIDGQMNLLIGNKKADVHVIVKREIKPYHIPELVQTGRRHRPLLVVAERLYPAQREALRAENIGYLDTAGNIFLDLDDIYLWVEGNKETGLEKTPITNRAFTKAGLKVVFYFLIHEDLLNLPYRTVAGTANVAIGGIKPIIDGLDEAGFILRVNKTRKVLQNKKGLLERWMAAYEQTLRPALFKGTYAILNTEIANWNKLPKVDEDYVWGGEPAAEKLTRYLNPGTLTLYTNNTQPFFATWRLLPKKEGPIKVYRKFWTDTKWDEQQLAPPLLVYVDLMLTDEPRCIETAEIIYKEYLKEQFDER